MYLYLILNKIHTNTKTVLPYSATVIALALIIALLAMSEDALAKSKQTIKQFQSNKQGSLSVSGGGNFLAVTT